MKNYSTVLNHKFIYLDNEENKLVNQLELIRAKRSKIIEITNSISFYNLNKCFDKLKLDIVVKNITQSGEELIDIAKRPVILAIRATPLPGCTIKPAYFKGYTKSGSSLNDKLASDKALKLEQKILMLTGYRCSISKFNFDLHPGNEFSILIDITIPNL